MRTLQRKSLCKGDWLAVALFPVIASSGAALGSHPLRDKEHHPTRPKSWSAHGDSAATRWHPHQTEIAARRSGHPRAPSHQTDRSAGGQHHRDRAASSPRSCAALGSASRARKGSKPAYSAPLCDANSVRCDLPALTGAPLRSSSGRRTGQATTRQYQNGIGGADCIIRRGARQPPAKG